MEVKGGRVLTKRGDTPGQNCVESLISNFIVGSVLLLKIVEKLFFVVLITCLAPNRSDMSRNALAAIIEKTFIDATQYIINVFPSISYIGTTAEILSGNRRSYFRIAAHWIDLFNSTEFVSIVLQTNQKQTRFIIIG